MNITIGHTPISQLSQPHPKPHSKLEVKGSPVSEQTVLQPMTAEEAKSELDYLKNVIIALPALVLRVQSNLRETPNVGAV